MRFPYPYPWWKVTAINPTPADNGFSSPRQHAHSSITGIVSPLRAIPGGGFFRLALGEGTHSDLAERFEAACFAAGVA